MTCDLDVTFTIFNLCCKYCHLAFKLMHCLSDTFALFVVLFSISVVSIQILSFFIEFFLLVFFFLKFVVDDCIWLTVNSSFNKQHEQLIQQALVVQTLDSTIHRINHYPVKKYYRNQYYAICWIVIYPLESAAIQSLNNHTQLVIIIIVFLFLLLLLFPTRIAFSYSNSSTFNRKP